MPKKCKITGKTKQSGNNRSKALNATKRKWKVNLQRVNIEVDGKPQKMWISTRGLKTLKKQNKSK